jgi:hypothetical protein
VACPLCRQRKGKRFCPAKQEAICAPCCGSKRLVEIACPTDCVYLGQHAGGWEGRETERRRDLRRVAPHLQELSEAQTSLYFLSLVGVVGLRARRRDLDDRMLLAAVAALRKTLETRSRGILYEHQAEDARAQAVIEDLKGLFESKDEQGRAVTPSDRDLLAVLAALEASVAGSVKEGAGATAFLDTATRIAGQLAAAEAKRPRPLIVEP